MWGLRKRFTPKPPPLGAYQEQMGRLERCGAPEVLDIEVPSWSTRDLAIESKVVSEATEMAVPACGQFLPEQRHVWEALRLWTMGRVLVDVDSGLAFHGDCVLAQSGGGARWVRDAAFISGAFIRSQRGATERREHPVAVLGDTHHHYHFLIETLPRVLELLRQDPRTEFITSQSLSPTAEAALSHVGVTVARVPINSVIDAGEFRICDHPDRFWPRPSDLALIRDAYVDWMSPGFLDPADAIYIFRSRSSRSPEGEADLHDLLHGLGVEVLHLQDFTLQEQIERTSRAGLVIGPHGAGLSNIAFLQPGATVVELTSGQGFEPCYRRMAASLNLSYEFVLIPGGPLTPYGEISEKFLRAFESRISELVQ